MSCVVGPNKVFILFQYMCQNINLASLAETETFHTILSESELVGKRASSNVKKGYNCVSEITLR